MTTLGFFKTMSTEEYFIEYVRKSCLDKGENQAKGMNVNWETYICGNPRNLGRACLKENCPKML